MHDYTILLFLFFIVGGVKGQGRAEEDKIVVFNIGPANINLLFLNHQTR
jgi:hypothetical protein